MRDRFDDDEEREFYNRYRAYFAAPGSNPSPCPEEKVLAGFLYEVLSQAELRRVEAQVSTCASWTRRLEELRHSDEQLDAEPLPDAIRERIQRNVDRSISAATAQTFSERLRTVFASFWSWKLAGALAAVFIVALFVWIKISSPPLISNGPDESDIRGQFNLIRPLGKLPAAPSVFDWERAPNAIEYIITIYEAKSSQPLYEQTIIDNKLTLPEEVRDQLKPGQTYRWRVKGLARSGEVISFKQGQFEIQK